MLWRGAFIQKEVPQGSGSYQLVAPVSVEATIGTVASGTAGTIDRTVWDRSTSFVVDLYPNHTLSSTTEADVQANPELNLACVGSGTTYYIFQFTTVSAGTPSPPYQARYTVSGILWDRFGSGIPPAGSLAGLNFVLLNSAVKPVAVPLQDFGVPRNYKCPSSGQSTDVAETVPFTLAANSIRPLAPSNLRGERDSAGTLLVEWTRRSRLAQHLRDYADVPVAEEREVYVAEIYDGPTLKRTMRAITGMTQAAVIVSDSDPGNKFDGVSGNTVSGKGGGSFNAAALQSITRTGNVVEGTVSLAAINSGHRAVLGLIATSAAWQGSSVVPPYAVRLQGNGASRDLTIEEDGVAVFTISTAATSYRVKIVLSGSEVRFYLGDASKRDPDYVSPVAPAYPLRPWIQVNGGLSGVSKVVLTTDPDPKTIYSAAQQVEDFGSTQSSIKVRVAQESAVVGRGAYAEANL